MTYTPEQIHAMSDPELCEAISETRLRSGEGITDCFMLCDPGEHYPLNWLEWNNAGRLLEEINNVSLKRYEHQWQCGSYNDFGNILCASLIGLSPIRAICETWLIWFQENHKI